MSPVNEPQLFKGGGGGRLLGLRESNQALAELKTKLEFALSRLNDQDTQRTGIEEIREFLQTLYPDWFPMVISCIGEAGTNLKPLGRCESVKLLGLLAELHGDAVVPLLARILQVVVTRLQDADLHLREACAETVFRLARSLVVDAESAGVFGTLLKPLFGALGEHSKCMQTGAALCICSVIQGSPPSVVNENLGRLCSRLVQHLSLPLAMAKPQLLHCCIYAMEAVKGAVFDEVLPSLMPCLESCLNASSDWQTRKQAIEVLQTIGDNPELGQSLDLAPVSNAAGSTPLQRRIALLLEGLRTDKVRAVREAVKDTMLRWAVTTKVLGGPPSMVRSSSPVQHSAAWQAEAREALQQRQGSANPQRSSSPIAGSWMEREGSTSRVPEGGASTSNAAGGNAGVRQNRSVRAATRERPGEPDVTVLVPPERPGARQGGEGNEATQGDRPADAASEKARAIKAALSGAALNSTKKPRPKRERQSIFNGPSNAGFFKPAPASGGVLDEMEEIDPGAEEGPEGDEDAMRAADLQALQEEEDLAVEREMRAAQLRAKRTVPATRPDRAANGSAGAVGPGERQALEEAWPETDSVETPAWARDDAVRSVEERMPSGNAYSFAALDERVPTGAAYRKPSEAPLDERMPTGTAYRPPSDSYAEDVPEDAPLSEDGVAPPSAIMQPAPEAAVVASTSARRIPPGSSQRSASPYQAPALASAAARFAGAQAVARASPPSPRPPSSDARPASPPNALLEELAERLQIIEDEKRESEARFLAALQTLQSVCDGQSEALAAQGGQLQLTEQRLQLQEQQCRHNDQRVQQQEQQLRQQEKRLHEQELQIQQLEQQFDDTQQVLREHEQQMEQQAQQMEQQDQLIEEQKIFGDEQRSVADEQKALVNDLADQIFEASASASRAPSARVEEIVRPAAPLLAAPVESLSRLAASSASLQAAPAQQALPLGATSSQGSASFADLVVSGESSRSIEGPRAVTAAQLRESLMQAPLDSGRELGSASAMAKSAQAKKVAGPLWDKVLELCEEQRYLEAYKQVIAEPEEICLLRLMQHTGPIVEQLDAESNSRLIRRLIHILSSPKEPTSSCIEQVFAWLWQALDVGIHFTSSQVEDLASALQKASAPHSFRERAEAAQLLSRVSALRRT